MKNETWRERFEGYFKIGEAREFDSYPYNLPAYEYVAIKLYIAEEIDQARLQEQERVVKVVEDIHNHHYSVWLPTEEQKGYSKAQHDIIKAIKRE